MFSIKFDTCVSVFYILIVMFCYGIPCTYMERADGRWQLLGANIAMGDGVFSRPVSLRVRECKRSCFYCQVLKGILHVVTLWPRWHTCRNCTTGGLMSDLHSDPWKPLGPIMLLVHRTSSDVVCLCRCEPHPLFSFSHTVCAPRGPVTPLLFSCCLTRVIAWALASRLAPGIEA